MFVNLQLGVAPERLGNRDRHRAPQGMYLCADGRWLAAHRDRRRRLARGLTACSGAPTSRRTSGSNTSPVARPRTTSSTTRSARGPRPSTRTQGLPRAAGARASPPRRASTTLRFATDPQIVDRQWIRPLASRDVGTFNHLGTGVPWHPVGLGTRRADARRGQRVRLQGDPRPRRRRVPTSRRRAAWRPRTTSIAMEIRTDHEVGGNDDTGEEDGGRADGLDGRRRRRS